MNALDSLKMDIYDYNEVLASNMEALHSEIKELCHEYYKMDVLDISMKIEDLWDSIRDIESQTELLRKMESYYKIFKQEQERDTDKEFNFLEEFEKWETEHRPNKKYDDDGGVHRMKYKVTCKEDKPFTLCIVKDGEVSKEVKVNTDEFIQIMHEQAEGENK